MENEFDFVVGYPRLFSKTTALRRLLKAEKIQRQHFLYVGDEVRNVEIAQIAAESLLAPAVSRRGILRRCDGCWQITPFAENEMRLLPTFTSPPPCRQARLFDLAGPEHDAIALPYLVSSWVRHQHKGVRHDWR